ncbi:MAG: hypothetical protein ACI92S_003446, partial [Planctomycetaceae bacterium]
MLATRVAQRQEVMQIDRGYLLRLGGSGCEQ